uniref:Uncharacterized protein n=1 Tax=Hyaloperonospora arabidopsidis (strain Emoy2) TaxID=559515 RepID=M4BUG0_HYAAE
MWGNQSPPFQSSLRRRPRSPRIQSVAPQALRAQHTPSLPHRRRGPSQVRQDEGRPRVDLQCSLGALCSARMLFSAVLQDGEDPSAYCGAQGCVTTVGV